MSLSNRQQRRADTCARKIAYSTWDSANEAGLAVWREAPSPRDANGPLPYPCDLCGQYHIGHIRSGRTV